MHDTSNQHYWDDRGGVSYCYKGETFYTVTPIPYYYRRRAVLLALMRPLIEKSEVNRFAILVVVMGFI